MSIRIKTAVVTVVSFAALLAAFNYAPIPLDWPVWVPYLILGSIFVLIMMVFLDRAFLAGVRHLNASLQSISETTDLSARLPDATTSELTDLSGHFNELLAKFHQSQRGLLDTQATLRTIVDNMLDVVFQVDLDGVIKYASPSGKALLGHNTGDMMGQAICDFIHADDVAQVRRIANQAVELLSVQTAEFRIRHINGKYIWVEAVGKVLFDRKRSLTGGIICCRDITQRIAVENRLKYLSLHDALTGLYNRTYFRQEMVRLASSRYVRVGLIVCDVDGLKLYNDSLGHDSGDMLLKAAANVLRNSFRESDIVARIGGDEFAVLLPDATHEALENACTRIRQQIEDYNANHRGLSLSLSMGWAITEELDNIGELFKEADDNMYREKLHRSRSTRSAIVQVLAKTLEERDFNNEEESNRLQDLTVQLGESVGLPGPRLANLRLLAQFHDLGQVGMPDDILFKEAPLTSSEMAKMQTHCEIGSRIAMADTRLTPIADWILKHHEWWNGQGYPTGAKEQEIPLECRILAVVDAYDAMTRGRPYRKPLSQEDAIGELQRCSGTQFDPRLVDKFVELLVALQAQ